MRVLFLHTAFIGDILLSLPAVQALKRHHPDARITYVAIPAAAAALEHHPAIDEIVVYDKRGTQRGLRAFIALARRLRKERFDLAIVPHRSIRSALIVYLGGIPRRIGFSTSSGARLFTDRVTYESRRHEIDRDLDLLRPLDIVASDDEMPDVYPNENDRTAVSILLEGWIPANSGVKVNRCIAIAPGSVWATKRWPEERFTELGKKLAGEGFLVALIGGNDDAALCTRIASAVGEQGRSFAGKLTLLQSAELLRRCQLLVTNDSAPLHLAAAVRTPVVALFGATVPAFGFGPRGPRDRVLETLGLSCRPCSIHGGDHCPIGTFECMYRIEPEDVLTVIRNVVSKSVN